jgi:hypothetical protein
LNFSQPSQLIEDLLAEQHVPASSGITGGSAMQIAKVCMKGFESEELAMMR